MLAIVAVAKTFIRANQLKRFAKFTHVRRGFCAFVHVVVADSGVSSGMCTHLNTHLNTHETCTRCCLRFRGFKYERRVLLLVVAFLCVFVWRRCGVVVFQFVAGWWQSYQPETPTGVFRAWRARSQSLIIIVCCLRIAKIAHIRFSVRLLISPGIRIECYHKHYVTAPYRIYSHRIQAQIFANRANLALDSRFARSNPDGLQI